MGLASIGQGNLSVKKDLISFLQKKRIPSVSLFYGPSGSGKSFFAKHFIMDVLCATPKDFFCCNECPSCKTVPALTSPDLLKISSIDGSSLKLEDSKKAQDFSVLQPVYSERKVIWIEDAHLLTTEAFNSILKILEEPNSTTIFLLTTSKLDSILPTVRSRSTLIPFASYSETELQSILKAENCPDSLIMLLSKIGNGNAKKALSYMDPINLENRKTQIDNFLSLIQKSSFISSYGTKDEILNFISTAQTVIADLFQLKLIQSETGIINVDYFSQLNGISRKVDLEKLIKVWDLFLQAEIDLVRVNVNVKAYFELLSVSVKNVVLFC